jgi:hypothetical protein
LCYYPAQPSVWRHYKMQQGEKHWEIKTRVPLPFFFLLPNLAHY